MKVDIQDSIHWRNDWENLQPGEVIILEEYDFDVRCVVDNKSMDNKHNMLRPRFIDDCVVLYCPISGRLSYVMLNDCYSLRFRVIPNAILTTE